MLQDIDHSVAGSMTAQPLGFRPSTLRVATHGLIRGWVSYPSEEVQSVYSTAAADRALAPYGSPPHRQQVASFGGGVSYPSAKVQSAYSTAPDDRVVKIFDSRC